MSLLSTVSTYRCDGCGTETPHPHGWRSLKPIHFGNWVLGSFAEHTQSEDYCHECLEKMRLAVKKVVTA